MEKVIIEGGQTGIFVYLKRVISARTLIFTLAKRDLKARYAQTIMGILWAVLQPLAGLVIFTLFFDVLIEVDTGAIPYPLFAFTGMVAWYFFSSLLRESGSSLIQSQELIKNLAFPRMVLPLSKVLVTLVEFGISIILLIIMMLILGIMPGWQILFLPVMILINLMIGLTVGFWLASLTIRYRDFQHIIPYLTNFGIWLTPVFYPSTLIPEQYSYLLYLNPMAGVVEGYRWSILGGPAPSLWYGVSYLLLFGLFIGSVYYFRRTEERIADQL